MTQLFLLRLAKESVRHEHEDSKADLKFLVEDERFYVNQLISKVRNQLGTNANALRSIIVWETCCFDRLMEIYEEVVCYIELRNLS